MFRLLAVCLLLLAGTVACGDPDTCRGWANRVESQCCHYDSECSITGKSEVEDYCFSWADECGGEAYVVCQGDESFGRCEASCWCL